MTNQLCQRCGAPLKTIPAGVSKNTGRAYGSFLACPNKCIQPKQAEPVAQPAYRPVAQPAQPAQPVYQNQPDWDKIREEKNSNIRWMNALNCATLLAAHGVIQYPQIEEKANAIYRLEPQTKPVNLNKIMGNNEAPMPEVMF